MTARPSFRICNSRTGGSFDAPIPFVYWPPADHAGTISYHSLWCDNGSATNRLELYRLRHNMQHHVCCMRRQSRRGFGAVRGGCGQTATRTTATGLRRVPQQLCGRKPRLRERDGVVPIYVRSYALPRQLVVRQALDTSRFGSHCQRGFSRRYISRRILEGPPSR